MIMDIVSHFSCLPLLYCLGYALLFVFGLYFDGSNLRTSVRDHPKTIKRRFISVLVTCSIIVVHVSTFVHKSGRSRFDLSSYHFEDAFMTTRRWLESVLIPLLLTMTLYLGAIVDDLLSGRLKDLRDPDMWRTVVFSWIGIRNLVVAPMAEELVYRACIMYHLQPLFSSCHTLCLVSPLFFSIAHFHHMYEQIREGHRFSAAFQRALLIRTSTNIYMSNIFLLILAMPLSAVHSSSQTVCWLFSAYPRNVLIWVTLVAFIRELTIVRTCKAAASHDDVFQVFYTTLFGIYSGFLMLRTGNVLSAMVAHSVCNIMGLPDILGALDRGKAKWGVFGQLLVVGTHLLGLILWFCLLYSVTNPLIFANRATTCHW